MSVIVFYVDLRKGETLLQKFIVEWSDGLEADPVLEIALGKDLAEKIKVDLASNNQEIIVSWNNLDTGEHSEMGGIGTLSWVISNNSILTIVYEDQNTTEDQVNKSNEWMLENSQN